MNVFKYETMQNKKMIIGYCISLAALIFSFMAASPIFIDETSGIKDMLEKFPDAFTKGMGISSDFFSVAGFYSYIMNYLLLIGAIQAMFLGLSAISKENRMRTADFLMTKPKSRREIYLQKLLSSLFALFITDIVFVSVTILSAIVFNGTGSYLTPLLLISLSIVFSQIIFLALGFLIAGFFPRIKQVIAVTMGFVFGFFLLGILSGVLSSEIMRFLSPFKYFDGTYIITNRAYEVKYIIISAVVTGVSLSVSFYMYTRRDVHAVT